ncbi:MAG: hypothetical protein H6936_01480 [Burkholderiales bacterium]|nr:hypothetical protein [Nitrosomonas sp.]MCP5273527.1 hypothetical protein [Burkholderiales bacterium]
MQQKIIKNFCLKQCEVLASGMLRDTNQLNRIVLNEIPASTLNPNQAVEATQNAAKKNIEFNNKNDSYKQEKSKWIQVLSAFIFKLLCFAFLFIVE